MKQNHWRRAGFRVLITAVGAAVLASCGGSTTASTTIAAATSTAAPTTSESTTTAAPTSTAAPTTEAPTTTGAPTTTVYDVAQDDPVGKFLLTDVPDDYALSVNPDLKGGPLDLNGAVDATTLANARKVLTKNGFVHGYQRVWEQAGSTKWAIGALLYEFRTAEGAAVYCKAELDDSTVNGGDVARVPIAGTANATLIASGDEESILSMGIGSVGKWCYATAVFAPPDADPAAVGTLTVQLTLQQEQKLSAKAQ